MKNLEAKIKTYEDKVIREMSRRGISDNDIPRVIAKTGFYEALNNYPEEQLHYSIEAAVDEILVTASVSV